MTDLPAGRELDAEVGVKIFGKVANIDDPGLFWGSYDEPMYRDKTGRWDRLPFYSTDIAAAWQIVEQLKGERYFWLGWHVRDGRFQWECRFAAPEQYAALAETVPLAICRAALQALTPSTHPHTDPPRHLDRTGRPLMPGVHDRFHGWPDEVFGPARRASWHTVEHARRDLARRNVIEKVAGH